MPSGRVDVVRPSGAGLMTIVSFWLAVCVGLPESVTVTVIGELPAVVGVPVIVHPVRMRPAGRVPVIEQVYGPVPPDGVMVPVYPDPTVPGGNVPVIVSGAGLITMVSFWLAF